MLPSAVAWIAFEALPAMLALALEQDVEGVADSSSARALRCKRDLGTAGAGANGPQIHSNPLRDNFATWHFQN